MKLKYDFYQSRSKYKFCEIPNDEEGKLFIKQLRKYLNKGKYRATVKGQYLDTTKHRWQDHVYGAPIDCCTHLRVYITEKNHGK